MDKYYKTEESPHENDERGGASKNGES